MKTKSELYAERDGIQIEEGIGRGGLRVNVYLIPCSKCGRIIKRQIYKGYKEYICDYCKLSLRNKEKAEKELNDEDVMTKKEIAFEKAVRRIQDQVKNFNEYEKAIELAKTRVEKYGSIPEVMVAIELLRLGYKIIPQQKVGKYNVDFAIPKEKLIVEVDGKLYHKNGTYGEREAIIQVTIGLDWQIIHIPAEKISANIQKLNDCILEILQHRGKNNMIR